MGLDLALGGLVLFTAVRGWLRGFVVQAIRIGGLIAAVYVAAPVRDQARPYALDYLPSMQPHLVDRLLWWASAVTSYFVLVGVASLLVAVSRRQPYGLAEPNRGDQFAGFGLGVLKGLLVASFLVGGVKKYGEDRIVSVDWVRGQTQESFAWEWNQKYRPASTIWHSQPVQQFVTYVHKMGIQTPAVGGTPAAREESPVQTASRVPKLAVPPGSGDSKVSDLLREVDAELGRTASGK